MESSSGPVVKTQAVDHDDVVKASAFLEALSSQFAGYTFQLELKRVSNLLLLMDAALFGGNERYEEVSKKEDADMVNDPPHYRAHAMECFDEMLEVFGVEAAKSYCRCAAWKYRYRAKYKGDEKQDNDKADWYIAKLRELQDGESTE